MTSTGPIHRPGREHQDITGLSAVPLQSTVIPWRHGHGLLMPRLLSEGSSSLPCLTLLACHSKSVTLGAPGLKSSLAAIARTKVREMTQASSATSLTDTTPTYQRTHACSPLKSCYLNPPPTPGVPLEHHRPTYHPRTRQPQATRRFSTRNP